MRKLTILIILTLTVMVANSQALNGVYTINPVSANYPSFTAAVDSLIAYGVSGPVVFNVAAGTYTEQISIPKITGASATNTITFSGVAGDSTAVEITYTSSMAFTNYTVRLDSADYIIFKNMTISAPGYPLGRAVVITDNADHNEFSHNVVKSYVTNLSFDALACFYITSSTDIISYNKILNNNIQNGSYAIYMRSAWGSSGIINKGTVIEKNIITGFGSNGIYADYEDSLQITSNTIESAVAAAATVYAIYITNSKNGIKILKNTMLVQGPTANTGINLSYCNGSATNPILIANNFISQSTGTGTTQGICLYRGNYQNVYFNSINITAGSVTTGRAIYLLTGSAGGYGNNNVMNNNAVNTGGGYAIEFSDADGSNGNYFNSANNNLYATGTNTGKWDGTNVTTLAAWQTASGKDGSSVSVSPGYTSTTDLHTTTSGLNGVGTAVTEVTDDIDGDTRLSAPDIGADEFSLTGLDAAISWVAPVEPFTYGLKDVKVKIANARSTTITAVQIAYTDGTTPVTETFGGLSIAQESDAVITFATQFNHTDATQLRAYIININGGADDEQLNDTTGWQNLYLPLNGIYTIDSSAPTARPNYNNFTDAVNALISNGVSGAVTFNVAAGTYVEQIVVPEITGASATNTITFTGTSGDSTAAELRYAASGFTDNYTIQLNGADYISFKNLKIIATDTGSLYYSRVIYITNGADYNEFSNNLIIGRVAAGSITSYETVIYGYTPSVTKTNDYNIFRNNNIQKGSIGIALNGLAAKQEEDNIIEGNVLSGFWGRGISAMYQDSVQIISNTITNTQGAGIYANQSDNGMQIVKNNITNSLSVSGIHVETCDGTISEPVIIANNFISYIGGTSGFTGIYNYLCRYNNIHYNTINMTTGSTTDAAIFFEGVSGYGNIDVRNNNIVNKGGGYAMYVTTTAVINNYISYCNYNNYYVTGTNIGNWNNTDITSFALWKPTTGLDANSINVNPWFVSSVNLHTTTAALDGAGIYTTGITDDIDGDKRFNPPDIGADEFIIPIAYDAGVTAILHPATQTTAGSTDSVTVTIKNFGTTTLTSIPVEYIIDNGTPVQETWTGSLTTNSTTNYTFATKFVSPIYDYNVCAYTQVINDTYTFNDSSCTSITVPASEDVGVSAIIEPASQEIYKDTIHVTVTIKNFGSVTQTSVPIEYVVDNGTPIQETWTGTLLAGATDNYTFIATFVSPITDYNLCAYTSLITDADNSNDTTCAGVTALVIADAGVTAIIQPVSPTIIGSTVTVEINIKNYGQDTLKSIPVGYTVDITPTASETWTGTLLPGDSTNYTFATTYTSPSTQHDLCVYTMLANDATPANNLKCETMSVIVGMKDNMADAFNLLQNKPNPATGITVIPYDIPAQGEVQFSMMNVLGQKIYTDIQTREAGRHQFKMDVTDMPQGLYYYSIEYNGKRLVKKMIIK